MKAFFEFFFKIYSARPPDTRILLGFNDAKIKNFKLFILKAS